MGLGGGSVARRVNGGEPEVIEYEFGIESDLADIQTLLKRAYYRGVGLRLTREEVKRLFTRDGGAE